MRRHCIIITIIVVLREIACREFFNEEGPYEARVINLTTCVAEKPWFHANVTTYSSGGRNLLRGRFVANRTVKNVKFTIALYHLGEGKVKAFELKNQNCHNILVRTVLKALGVKYNEQRCFMEPTSSEFSNLDLNAIIHSVVQSLWYGLVVIRWEISMPSNPLMCLDITVQMFKVNGEKIGTVVL